MIQYTYMYKEEKSLKKKLKVNKIGGSEQSFKFGDP